MFADRGSILEANPPEFHLIRRCSSLLRRRNPAHASTDAAHAAARERELRDRDTCLFSGSREAALCVFAPLPALGDLRLFRAQQSDQQNHLLSVLGLHDPAAHERFTCPQDEILLCRGKKSLALGIPELLNLRRIKSGGVLNERAPQTAWGQT